MKNTKPKRDANEGSDIMKRAAAKGSTAAKEALVASVEESIPAPEGESVAAHRQLGAIITAATGIYADMLYTIVDTYKANPALAKHQAVLAAGILQDLVAQPLLDVGAIADGTYKPD